MKRLAFVCAKCTGIRNRFLLTHFSSSAHAVIFNVDQHNSEVAADRFLVTSCSAREGADIWHVFGITPKESHLKLNRLTATCVCSLKCAVSSRSSVAL